MRLEPGTGTVRVTHVLSDGSEGTPDERFLDRPLLAEAVTVTDVITPRGGKVAAGEVVLRFDTAGLDDFTIIHLKGDSDAAMTVMAYPSGKVTVSEGYQEEPQ
ncbi:general secretion pathway protein GspH, partial [bacterium]|nr:general secretion pathway protein GspH [bacterium]